MKKYALISTYRKEGVEKLAEGLCEIGYEIISTGGTAKYLREKGINVKEVSTLTNFPEILAGRVKTLHPALLGGILSRRDNKSDTEEMDKFNLPSIDIVVVNLYPFEETIKPHLSTKLITDEILENIDIGGVTLLRAAAKNFKDVIVIVDPADYEDVLSKLKSGFIDISFRKHLATKAFLTTAYYDALISNYFSQDVFPENLVIPLKKHTELRYGENPHQRGILYRMISFGLPDAEIIQGKELSFNNYLDLSSAYQVVNDFKEPTCVIIKHNNPCGVASDFDPVSAYKYALRCDPVSAFGGIVGFNCKVDEKVANEIVKIFTECVIAPDYTDSAIDVFSAKKDLRVIKIANIPPSQFDLRGIVGGFLVQEPDNIDYKYLKVVSERSPSDLEMEGLIFSFKVVKHVRSNAIVLAQRKRTVGIGAGQMSRIDSLRIASLKMKKESDIPLVLASDAFFPFPDVVEEAAKIGVSAIIQPGGSVKDEDSIKLCNKYKIAMVFTGTRHFKH